MQQQENHFEELNYSAERGYSGKEAEPPYNSYANSGAGQKLADANPARASAAQRLTLAIASIIAFMIMIFGLFLISLYSDPSVTSTILIVIIIFGAVITLINAIFNRGR
ncbi:hypothetical protein EPA93_31490 [Ktedonosporobacter rubrisoli]|uniref:Uncharacterized protein n=1 Tax=Ktedonosporobacter rubrisoli TaxID=2509675 RepID=A0A4P6JX03_KTERU|nr:hypothetical protein [Ktedonosporobacter rubrisoli]QBD80259.1 hypothetical protein EPA93_31490 [Ktedonosporobacter rubrisoli]